MMGILDSILGSDKPEVPAPGSSNPFNMTVSFAPLRLNAKKSNSVSLVVKVKNVSGNPQLVSVDALLPRDAMLGFDPPCINKAVEKRMGELKPGATIEVSIPVWANNQTKEGAYAIDVTVFSHYIGYEKVLSYLKKSTSLRAV
jgi:uncharacterized membrane protein